MVPTNCVFSPSVAELPTCQITLHAWADPTRTMLLPDAVISVLAIWNMKTALASPLPSSVRAPVMPSDDVDLYTPVARVWPPRSPATPAVDARPAASLYATVSADCAVRLSLVPKYSAPAVTISRSKEFESSE